MKLIVECFAIFFAVVLAGAILGVVIFNRKPRYRLPRRARSNITRARTKIYLPKEPEVAGDGAWGF